MAVRSAVLSFLVVSTYLFFGLESHVVDWLTVEDGPVEMLGALSLATTAGAFLVATVRARRTPGWRGRAPAYAALALLFLLGAGEEVSWGQRLFGWTTPEEVAAVNVQHETNLHNLAFMRGWLDAGRLFNLFTFAFVLGLPLAARVAPRQAERLGRYVPVPPLALAMPFVANQLASKIAERLFARGYTGRFDFVQCVTELKETDLALLFVVVALTLLRATTRDGVAPAAVLTSPAARA